MGGGAEVSHFHTSEVQGSAAMAALESISGLETFVRALIADRKTHAEVSLELKRRFPSLSRGLSSRSIKRFCLARGIHATSRLSDSALDRVVCTSIQKVQVQ